jgi:hypothetical protein
MSWVSLNDSVRTTDWSYFQYDRAYRAHDIDKFCSDHPEVGAAVVRFCWPSGVKDARYDHYYDGFTRNGKIVMGYGWPNPRKSVGRVIDDWMDAMGDRVPKVILGDWEDVSTFEGKSPAQLADHMKALNHEKHFRLPDVVHGEYSRGGWLDLNMLMSAETRAYNWWLAHWPWGAPDFKDQAHTFSEMDAWLPIDNNFTPYRGRIALIPESSVVGWQATSQLDYLSRGWLDGGYFKDSFLNPIFGGGATPPDPPDPTEKAIVEVKVVQGEAEIRTV